MLKIGKLIAFILIVGLLFVVFKVLAATTPTFGDSSSYAVLSSTYTDTSAATTINGSVGFTTPPATAPLGTHTNYGSGAPYSLAGTDQASIIGNLNAQTCNFNFGSATDLSLLSQPLTPGVYCITGAQSVGTGGITLLAGTYVFRSTGALNTVANSTVSGGNACDIFWTPVATTLGENSTFKGTVIDDSGITVGSTVTWNGRALAFGGTVTTDTDTITVPSCINSIVDTVATTTTPVTVARQGGHRRVVATPVVVEVPVIIPSLPNTGLEPLTTSKRLLLGTGALILISSIYLYGNKKKKINKIKK